MVEISEPLPLSTVDFMCVYNIFSNGQLIGDVDLKRLHEGEIETVKKYSKWKLFVGPVYGAQIFRDTKETGLTVDELRKKARAFGYRSRNEKKIQVTRKLIHLRTGTDRCWQADVLQGV